MPSLISQAFCSLTGHEDIRKFDGTRLYLECMNCGRVTEGLDAPATHPLAWSSKDLKEVYDFMIEKDAELRFGG